MIIKDINEVDLNELEKLYILYSREIEEPLTLNVVGEYFKDVLNKINKIDTLFFKVAIINNKIVGFIFFNTNYIYLNEKTAFILELYVDSNYRYNGIGRRLIKIVEEEIKDNEIKFIYLTSDDKFKLFYQKCDFTSLNIIDVNNNRDVYCKNI